MKIPVLTYHSTNISGNDYDNNDHVALQQDLALIHSLGIKILSAYDLVKWVKSDLTLDKKKKYVVITFDDGCDLDYKDWQHPQFGFQQSFYTILKQYPRYIHATSFVIVSASARKKIDTKAFASSQIWLDDWWQDAENSQLLAIENHSWNHLHHAVLNETYSLDSELQFSKINNVIDADYQIKQASDYINSQIKNKNTHLFAYPFGHVNPYLSEHYFPKFQSSIKAAFITKDKAVTQESNIWELPRYVCGNSWQSVSGLKKILEGNLD